MRNRIITTWFNLKKVKMDVKLTVYLDYAGVPEYCTSAQMFPALTDWLVVSPLLLLLLLLLLLAVLPFGTVDEEMGDELIWPSG